MTPVGTIEARLGLVNLVEPDGFAADEFGRATLKLIVFSAVNWT